MRPSDLQSLPGTRDLAPLDTAWFPVLMQWGGTGDWLSRAGLLLQFVSVFLVTPEILGAERLKILHAQLVTRTRRHSAGITVAVGLLLAGAALAVIALLSSVVEIRLTGWLGLAIVVAALYFILSRSNRLAAWLIRRALHYVEQPRSHILIGAFLFVVGFALDFLSTFFPQ